MLTKLKRVLLASTLLVSALSCRAQEGAVAVFPIAVNGQWGAIDNAGRVLVEPSFNTFSYCHPGGAGFLFERRQDGQQGLLLISKDEWLYVAPTGTKSFRPLVNDKPFYVHNKGESLFVIYTRSAEATQDAVIFDPIGEWQGPDGAVVEDWMSEGVFTLSRAGKFGYADRTGQVVIDTKYDACQPFAEGLAPVKQAGLWGYIDRAGDFVVAPQFSSAARFNNGLAVVTKEGTAAPFLIDRKGKFLHYLPHEMVNPESIVSGFSHGLLRHKDSESGNWGYLDVKGNWHIHPTFSYATDFADGVAAVKRAANQFEAGYIDQTGQFLVRVPGGRNLRSFRYGLAWVETRDAKGYINRSGEWVWTEK